MFGGVVFFAFVFIFFILLYVKNHSKSTFSYLRSKIAGQNLAIVVVVDNKLAL
jgi:hypothetical protein